MVLFLYGYDLGIGGNGKRGKAELMKWNSNLMHVAIYFAQWAGYICLLAENVSE